MVTLDQIYKRIVAALPDGLSPTEIVAFAVRETVNSVGFHVSNAGEVVDPRPAPNPLPPPRETGMYYSDQQRRRRRSGRR